ncbi:MAG: hypothetical protein KBD50_01575 [Candidatus Pacebacteria bacterium]|nr:hypothetical protein [Candidatus Paceibacterota bacterium]
MPPPEQNAPQDGNNPPQKPGEINLDAILLPKKGPAPSTERINAGALLQQEQNATLPRPEAAVPQAPSAPPQPRSIVQPLQTYKGDIESLIQDKNVSMVSIAAAEAEKRAQTNIEEVPVEKGPSPIFVFFRRSLMLIGGLALTAAAIGLGFYVYVQFTATVDIPQDTPAPFITVDKTTVVAVPQETLTRVLLMQEIEQARQGTSVPLGLIERILPAATVPNAEGQDTLTAIPAGLFVPTIAPLVPEELVRTLTKEFLLGIHVFDGPQAFMILHTDSYDQAFAAMLIWENSMRNELLPFFGRIPRPRTQSISSATSTATSTPQVRADFIDKIVENRDTRAIVNDVGDILLLWTFLDRNTLIITTNEYTLREIISRLSAPVTPGL